MSQLGAGDAVAVELSSSLWIPNIAKRTKYILSVRNNVIVSGAPMKGRVIEQLATKTRGFTVESRCSLTSSNLLTTTSVPSVNSEELGEPLQSGCFTPRFSFDVDDDHGVHVKLLPFRLGMQVPGLFHTLRRVLQPLPRVPEPYLRIVRLGLES